MRKIDTIAVHCAYTKPSQDIGSVEIRRWHKRPKPRGNGWRDIGYHYVIRRDGTVEDGRPNQQMGAHVKGHNRYSLGICLVGGKSKDGKPEDNFTTKQMKSLETLVNALMDLYNVPERRVLGHRDFPKVKKECPCFSVQQVLFNQPGPRDA